MHAHPKRGRSEDASADSAERLNKRIKETAEAEDMDVAEISVNQQDERELWDCGGDLQWAMDDHSGLSVDVELVRGTRAEDVKFMEGCQFGRIPVGTSARRERVSTKWLS